MLPKDWEFVKVEDVCQLGRGRVISQEEINKNPGIYPVYSSQSRDEGIFGYLITYDFDGEYVTWTTDGANAGTVFYRSGKFNCTNVCGTLKAKSHTLNMKFLALQLSRYTKQHVSYIGNPKLMNNVVAKIKIPLPPPAEQRRIAEILDTVDQTIRKTEQIINKLKSIKAGLLHDLLTRGIDENGNLRDPEKNPEEFREMELGVIPKDWIISKLGDSGDIVGGTTPSRSNPKYWNGKIAWITPSDIQNISDQYIAGGKDYISEEGLKSKSLTILPKGSIVVTTRATLGLVAIASEELTTNQGFRSIIVNDKFDTMYLYYLIGTFKSEMIRRASGTTFLEISRSEFCDIDIFQPPLNEQKKIGRILYKQDSLIQSELEYLDKLRLIKKGLMNDLLTGKVRVSTDEAVAV